MTLSSKRETECVLVAFEYPKKDRTRFEKWLYETLKESAFTFSTSGKSSYIRLEERK